MKDSNKEYRAKMSKNGLITLAVAAVVLALLILINVVVASLPANLRTVDVTENKMYSLTASAKREVAKLETAVDVYLIATGGKDALTEAGVHLNAFLENMEAVGKKVNYTIVDPLKDVAALEALGLTAETATELSVIVKSALRTRTVESSAFFSYYVEGVGKVDQTSAMYYYYYYNLVPTYVFDGETQILGAIGYVTDPELPTVYTLSGHSETALSETLLTQLDDSNVNVGSITLAGLTAIPSDCDMLIVNAPQSDLSDAEAKLLLDYLSQGGAIMLVTTPDAALFQNLGTVAASMGMAAEQGIIIETDTTLCYSQQAPYYLIPAISSHEMLTSGTKVVLPFSHGIRITDNKATTLYTTSAGAYMVALDAQTVEKPEGAESRSFCVGAISENEAGGKLVWIASNGFTADAANQVIGGGNYATVLAMTSYICGQSELPSFTPINMTSSQLTVTDTTAGMLSVFLMIVLPLAITGYGLFHIFRRKKR